MQRQPPRSRIRNVALIDSGALRPWRPTMTSGLQWWFAADHISGVAAGGAVSAWNDSSGNAYNLAQGTGSLQPTWQTNIINGKPIVRFDGSDYLPTASSFTINDTLSVIVVYASAIATRTVLIGQENTANAFHLQVDVLGSGNSQGGFGAIIPGVFVCNAQGARRTTGTFTIFCYTRNGAGATHAVYENGLPLTLNNNNTNSYSADGTKGLGRRGSGSESFNGDLAELMLWNVVISAETLRKAHLYLARKYGLLNAANLQY